MPEGDTIFRAARTLHRALAGKPVVGFRTEYAHVAKEDEDAPLTGRTVERVESRGKHLLVFFSGDRVLHTHLRMNGSWHIYRPGERWQRAPSHARLVLSTQDFVAVGFDVPVAELLDGAALRRHEALRALGPDLLSPSFDADEARQRLRAREALEVADALLDQRALAGIGNVYKSEVLFLEKVSPFAPVRALDDATLARLIATARRLMQANVHDGSSAQITTYSGLRRTTGRSDPSARLWVYGRGGAPCRRCGTPVECRAQGPHARLTYFCPTCQPPP
jgi:endonuclease-8